MVDDNLVNWPDDEVPDGASDAWFWDGYLHEEETEPDWIKAAVEKAKAKRPKDKRENI